MTDCELKRTLQAALFLIVLGCVVIGVADHWNWRDLAGAGGIVLGYGGGILQGKGSSQSQETKTGDIVNKPSTETES